MMAGSTVAPVGAPALPDQAERDRIRNELDTSFLVEAGAGSGKTAELVNRMLALLASDRAKIHQIAAVTFTRKAASELRERFQNRLEVELTRARRAGDVRAVGLLDPALRDIDRAFLGTIHSFCGRLLRERPIDAGLDPGFHEIVEPEAEELRLRFWHRFLEEEHAEGGPHVARLTEVGVRPDMLYEAFRVLDDHPDVDFRGPLEPVERPDPDAVRDELEQLLDRASALLPKVMPPNGWDELQKLIRRLRFSRQVVRWRDDRDFFDALAQAVGWKADKITLYKWGDDKDSKECGRALSQAFAEFAREGGPARETLERWYAHRYPLVIGFAQRAAEAFAAERRRTGRLGFQDLLMEARRLLRDSPPARRDLADRYLYLLVDEFQDTDPIQAEIVFLLTADDPTEIDWRRAVPKPGSLFVVGDPKQSIYRFTRADIAIYQVARRRFGEFRRQGRGDILTLVSNFRSRPPIGEFVNTEFENRFPAEATERQAAFAPLRPQRPDGPQQGVFRYEVKPQAKSITDEGVALEDAERLAAWIQRRVETGERSYGDFLILPYRKNHLNIYARALEARNIPVEVTGNKIEIEEELAEFRLLLEALLDPDDPVRTVAVLIGLFFGLDYEALTRHALAEGTFALTRVVGQPDGPVSDALAILRHWWDLSRRMPSDVVVDTVLQELGVLPYAAAGELGGPRAGAIGLFREIVRGAGLEGDTSLRGALEALDVALAMEDAVAPLQAGREDAVRVMNLHRAKGTEAPIVVLAHPTGKPIHPPELHIKRVDEGGSRGFMQISLRGGRPWDPTTIIARPLDWSVYQAAEQDYRDAESDRLLYVAATRTRDELYVSRCRSTDRRSFWEPFYGCLENWASVELDGVPRPPRRHLEQTAAAIAEEIKAVTEDRARRREPSYVAHGVTERVKSDGAFSASGSAGRGRDWGSAVHRALQAVGRGVSGDALRGLCRSVLFESGRRLREGEPEELEELVELVEALARSELLARARSGSRVLHEVPFARRLSNMGESANAPEVLEGVIDLVFREPDGWVVADYKTDEVDDSAELERRLAVYRAQVDLYAESWEELTGEPVKERILYLTAQNRIESW